MIFDTEYFNPMDRRNKPLLEKPIKDIGISHGIGDVLKGLKSKIFAGAGHVELGFMGKGKGSRYQPTGHTPESYGKGEREEIKQLAKINEVTLSTHATVAAQGFSGQTEKYFSDEVREQSLHEVRRAVDFAAETAGGGPVVVHTGEFYRPVSEFKKEGFEGYPGEEREAIVTLVDKRTGEILRLRKDTEIWVPEETKSSKPDEREYVVEEKTGRYKYKKMYYNDYEQNAEKLNKELRASGELKPNELDLTPAQLFYRDHMRRQLEQASAEERRWFGEAAEVTDQYNHLTRISNSINEQSKIDLEQARYTARNYLEQNRMAPPPGTAEYKKFLNEPEKLLQEHIEKIKRAQNYYRDASVSYGKQAETLKEQMNNLAPVERFGVEKSAQSLASAAIYAYDKEKALRLEKPLFISPENLFPETGYGAHPKELRELVVKSRNIMEKQLEARGFEKEKAKEVADNHIKATFDIGHANTWRKYFSAKSGEKPEDTDKRFKRWMNEEVQKLTKEGIIGHVHLSDNFGYYDEHLTPGQGSAPIEDFIKELKDKGFTGKMVAEPGGQGEGYEYLAMTGSWSYAIGSPIYRTATWTDIQGSYFGMTRSPNYIVGEYAPSKAWSFWSETPIE